jgi:hypothetical protein
MAQVLAVDGDGQLFENSVRIIECHEEPHREYRTTRSAAPRPVARRDRTLLWPVLTRTTAPRGNP